MTGIKDYVAFVLFGRAEQPKQRVLRHLQGKHVIVAAIHHQYRLTHSRSEVYRLNLGKSVLELQTSPHKHIDFYPIFDRGENRRLNRAPT